MELATLVALGSEFVKIAVDMEVEKYAEYFDKSAAHIDDRIAQRGGAAAKAASQHLDSIHEGLHRLRREHGDFIDGLPDGHTMHVDMPGKMKAIIQKIKGQLVPKTVLEEGMSSTSKGALMDHLRDHIARKARKAIQRR